MILKAERSVIGANQTTDFRKRIVKIKIIWNRKNSRKKKLKTTVIPIDYT